MIQQKIFNKIEKILKEYDIYEEVNISKIVQLCLDDLITFAKKDPSSNGDIFYIFETYKSYQAVLYYRVAHSLQEKEKFYYARKLSEEAKILTGIEIHPKAKIGKNFVIDHGVGTVIGETSIIGDDCYILQSVVLGASHIANNFQGQRHPIIGNNVEIGGFSRIFGAVKIGDNVKISPHSIIRTNIPSNSKVLALGINQFTLQGESKFKFKGYLKEEEKITFFFNNSLYNLIQLYIDDEEIKENIIIDNNKIMIINKKISNKLVKYKLNFRNNEEIILTV